MTSPTVWNDPVTRIVAASRCTSDSAARNSGLEFALVPVTTAGDRDRSKPFGEIGSRGVFVKELEVALLAGRIDVAVHSATDMTSPSSNSGRIRGPVAAR